MIIGIGIDMCSISRLEKALQTPAFIEKVFTEGEKDYALSRGGKTRHLASAFAAKEAFVKAGGWGLGRVGLKNVALERREGAPFLSIQGNAESLMQSLGVRSAHISVTHEGDYAVAVVILEG
jgi:holo-[acyl-carrier protein] synthase